MKDSRTRPFLLMLFGYIAIGGVVLTANTVLKTLLKEFSWTDAQGGLLISCMSMGNLTAVSGCLSRSVRDIARFLDVVSGFDRRDPFSRNWP